MMELAEDLPDRVFGHVRHFRITEAIAECFNLVRGTNRFVEKSAPWALAKEGKQKELQGVLYTAAELIRIVSVLLFPLMPNKMREIRSVFGLDDSTLSLDSARTWFDLQVGNKINLGDAAFPRLDPKKVPALVKKPGETESDTEVDGAGLVDISEFGKLDLRTATIEKAEKVKKADKLLRLEINIGGEMRQIVAGIAEHYKPEELIGKTIVVVTNLKPATIRGIESRGMLLAARKDGTLTLVTVADTIAPGAKIS
jgi:methionyl-tRNA synthetase